jgi:hypothetical protein
MYAVDKQNYLETHNNKTITVEIRGGYYNPLPDKYYVADTPMYPNRYKCESLLYPGRNNSFTEYFPTEELAQQECDRRNHLEIFRPYED